MKAYIENNPPVNLLKYLTSPLYSGSNFSNVFFTSRGRDAIQLAIDFSQIKEHDSVLLPALTCDTVSSVFASNCQTIYYDLNEDYSINVSVLEQFLKENPGIKLIYIIHYFGFIHHNMPQISSLCKKYGVILIEDHAHSALSDYNEELADIHIFSFRKLFPTADGGGIRITHQEIHNKFKFKHKLISNQKGLLIAFKRIASLYSNGLRSSVGKLIKHDINRLNNGYTRIDPLPVSLFGKGLISSSDINGISLERRKQYLLWNKLMASTPFRPIFPVLYDETVPFGFPIKLQNSKEIVDHFKRFNIFLKVNWSELPPDTKDSCPVSHRLAETSVTLPIYPGLKEKHMQLIKEEILKYGVPI